MGWAAVRRPRGILLPQGAGPAGCTPHFLFPLVEKKTGRARSKRKDRLDALRRVRASARRGSADRCKRRFWPAFGHAFPFCKFVTAVPWRMVRRSSGWSSHGAASLFAAASCPARELPIKASAPTTARAARSEAERAERGAGQMRPCTPIFVGTAPRESVFKSAPYSAAPVGKPSQPRRHHLTPTPVQQLCTHVQSCDQKRFFLFHRARRILFLSRTKREWGAHPPWKRPPGGSQSPRAVEKRLYTSAGGISGTEKRNLS